MGLSVELRRIMRAEVVPFDVDENRYGIAWTLDDGTDGVDLIGTRAEAEALLQDLAARQKAPGTAGDVLPFRFPKDTAAS